MLLSIDNQQFKIAQRFKKPLAVRLKLVRQERNLPNNRLFFNVNVCVFKSNARDYSLVVLFYPRSITSGKHFFR